MNPLLTMNLPFAVDEEWGDDGEFAMDDESRDEEKFAVHEEWRPR
jgi:hypothetical protein